MTKTPPRYPYIELMFAKQAKTGRRGEPETSSACLLADTIERTTTSNAQPYITTHGPSERDEARRPNETDERDGGMTTSSRRRCLLAYTTTWMTTPTLRPP